MQVKEGIYQFLRWHELMQLQCPTTRNGYKAHQKNNSKNNSRQKPSNYSKLGWLLWLGHPTVRNWTESTPFCVEQKSSDHSHNDFQSPFSYCRIKPTCLEMKRITCPKQFPKLEQKELILIPWVLKVIPLKYARVSISFQEKKKEKLPNRKQTIKNETPLWEWKQKLVNIFNFLTSCMLHFNKLKSYTGFISRNLKYLSS